MKRVLLLASVLIASYAQAQDVTNARFEQKGSDVHIMYSLSKSTERVTIEFSDNGGVSFRPIYKVTGDVGGDISKGDKVVVWDVLEEMDRVQGSNFKFRVIAEPKPIRFPDYSCLFGVRLGFNYSNIHMDDTDGGSGVASVLAGVFVDFELTRMFGLQIEALYTRLGQKDMSILDNYTYTYEKLTFDYFQVPILFKLSGFMGTIYAGPQFGHCFGAKYYVKDSYGDDYGPGEKLDTADLRTINIACVLGYMIKIKSFDFDFRYNINLNKVTPDIGVELHSYGLSVGYRF